MEKLEGLIKYHERKAYEDRIRELEEKNERLKASHILTHNKKTNKEKAKLYDVISDSVDIYLEKTKPYWEQIMIKEKMSIKEAETIIDDMYQDRHKIIQTKNDKGITIHINRLDDVKFTNLEFASVRTLREIQILRREIEQSIPKSKIQEKIEPIINSLEKDGFVGYADELRDIIQELMEDK